MGAAWPEARVVGGAYFGFTNKKDHGALERASFHFLASLQLEHTFSGV